MQNYGLSNSINVRTVSSSDSRYRPNVGYPSGGFNIRGMQGRSAPSLGNGRFLHTQSDPNKPLYTKIIGFFPLGALDLVEGTLVFTEIDISEDIINQNLLDKHPNAVVCYTLKQVREMRLFGVKSKLLI